MASSSRWSWLVLVVACVAGACSTSRGALTLGAASADLRRLDDTPVELEPIWKAHDALVLVWWGTSCPCVKRYQARMEDLRRRYPADRVEILAVDSNADDSAERIAAVAKERQFSLAILRDPSGKLADAAGARTTPTVVVIDRNGELRFRGWIDNERQPGEAGRIPYLENALDGLLAGGRFQERSPVYGCSITRSLLDPAPSCTSAPTQP